MTDPAENQTILETLHLTIQKWSMDDLRPAFELFSDAGIMRYIGSGKPFTLDDTGKFLIWIQKYQAENGFCRWKVVERSSGEIIGSCGFARLEDSGEIDFGYVMRRASWGQGLATEAAEACMHHGFNNLGFREIIAMTVSENIASRRVLEKIGFRNTGLKVHKGKDTLIYKAVAPSNIYE
jgi:RimJ/RimL family protein N-acetyltransferase